MSQLYVQQAEKELKSWFSFGTEKYEKASELYLKASQQEKLKNDWKKAGDYAVLSAKNHDKVEGGEYKLYHEAGVMYRRDPTCFNEACEVYNIAIERAVLANNLYFAAKLSREMAEMYAEENMFAEALISYQNAVNYFVCDSTVSPNASACQLKMAEIYIAIAQTDPSAYEKAVQLFETVVNNGNSLSRYSTPDYLFTAMLCVLASADSSTFEEKWERYVTMAPTMLDGMRKFIYSLIEAIQDRDVDRFEEVVGKYYETNKLDAVRTDLLLRAKTKMIFEIENLADEPDMT